MSSTRLWVRYETFLNELPLACQPFGQSPEELTYVDFVNHVDRFRALEVQNLEVEGGITIDNPDPAAISKALKSIDGKERTFAILTRSGLGMSYMQTISSAAQGLELEYQEGSIDKHFASTDEAIPLDQVIAAFVAYADGNDDWRGDFDWKRIDVP